MLCSPILSVFLPFSSLNLPRAFAPAALSVSGALLSLFTCLPLLWVSAECPSLGQPYLSALTRSGLSFQPLTAPSLFFPQGVTAHVSVYLSIRDCTSH